MATNPGVFSCKKKHEKTVFSRYVVCIFRSGKRFVVSFEPVGVAEKLQRRGLFNLAAL
ncbi:MAG: hypothetical protein GY820_44220 [Gammaproteobacteria bacterium]|nr:hypothetical protein [Gammaproteobacteria bacterium]